MRALLPSRLATLLLFCTATAWSMQPATYRSDYQPLSSGSWVQDKNFYVLTLFKQIPGVRAKLEKDPDLSFVLWKGISAFGHAKDPHATPTDYPVTVNELQFTGEDIELVRAFLLREFPQCEALQSLVENHLRPSGRYIRSANLTDANLLAQAWTEAAESINTVIRHFAFGKADSNIDSPDYNWDAPAYQRMVLDTIITATAPTKADHPRLFFESSLNFALGLMELNHRDEAARYEPLAHGENRAAMEAAKHLNWTKYKYASLLVHGIGSYEAPGIAITSGSRDNCTAAAKLYQEGLAPLIIVSGGYVHPKQTIFSEAVEMKKELMLVHDIPEAAILIDPQARHTGTNLRNGVRLLYTVGAPPGKPSLSIAQKDHSAGIARLLPSYGLRAGQRVNDNALEFYPALECLQTGADPLDP